MPATNPPPREQINELVVNIKRELAELLAQGKSPRVEEYFERYPYLGENDDDFCELAYEEFCLREEMGEKITAEDYCNRFKNNNIWYSEISEQLEYHMKLEGPHYAPAPIGRVGVPGESPASTPGEVAPSSTVDRDGVEESAVDELEDRRSRREYALYSRSNLDRLGKRLGSFLPTRSRERWLDLALGDLAEDLFLSLLHRDNRASIRRIIVKHQIRAICIFCECLWLIVRNRLRSEIEWVQQRTPRV